MWTTIKNYFDLSYQKPKSKPKHTRRKLFHYLDIHLVGQKSHITLRVGADCGNATECYRDFIKWFHCRPQSQTFRLKYTKGAHGLTRKIISRYELSTDTIMRDFPDVEPN